MKPMMKKTLAILSLSSMLTTGAAYAATTDAVIPDMHAKQIKPVKTQLDVSVQVNGEATEKGYVKSGAVEPMIPLRAVSESLGFTLTWNPETYSVDLSKGNLFTTVKTGEDRYTINKMLTELGTAPELVDSKLYVPASFITKILHATAVTEGNNVAISTKAEAKKVQSTGVITSIRTTGDNAQIQIQDTGTGGIVLNVNPETTYQMLDGTKLTLADLHVGLTITAEHSMAMTLSLPPQTSTSNITVLDTAAHKGALGTAGVIEAVREDGSLLVKGQGLTDDAPSEVVLTISADTAIVDGKGDPIDKSALVKGANVIGFYGPMMTKSLPPISNAWKIVVEAAQE
ncbi:copper amine oxidase N-terminal domain-containing protein [Paenibacillus sp. LMG 31461]|uniref:Copper amine oxidase N-terminal domain-containing protein n=1 Tax=Paenibacillus plantarum TaxID=2654975 RepID=A0ABX1XEP9_9BACL|nr:copper amine oxidase N-terminal domain-containing protein [Paenibacillus plantarum]NOU66914.1 copper amine oxidase N-terminal domain-containing protein [Paenibacillus plantarum]